MKEHPILFNAEMVKAVLAGKKTQTRRVIKPQPPSPEYEITRLLDSTNSEDRRNIGKLHWAIRKDHYMMDESQPYFSAPYGQVGDQLWVRERWGHHINKHGREIFCFYEDDPNANVIKWKPSIHMKREYCRINLEITDIRVERVQDITEEDARAEGVTVPDQTWIPTYKSLFEHLWDSINEERGYGWNVNPWTWVVEFKVL